MKLFIAEKPSLAQAIAAGIGVGEKFDGYISLNGGAEVVTWCYGHILEQLNPCEYDEKYQDKYLKEKPWDNYNSKVKLSAFYDNNNEIIEWYFDIAKEIADSKFKRLCMQNNLKLFVN